MANHPGARRKRPVDPSLKLPDLLPKSNQLLAINNWLRLHPLRAL
jgi:hypothetical protein